MSKLNSLPGSRGGRWSIGAACVIVGLLAPVQMAEADSVDQAERKVDQTVAELEQLLDDMGRIEEDYSGAQERQTELQQDIAESQVHIDEMNQQLGGVRNVLSDIALERFVSGDPFMQSPIFTNAATYSKAEQKSALGLAAIDSGETSMDTMQALFDQLNDEQARQQRKKEELTQLITGLEQKAKDYEALEKTYTEKVTQAKRDLGEAKLEAAREARAAAARARARRSVSSNSGGSSSSSSGGSGGSSSSSGGSSGGGGNYPAPSSRAQVAVNAALGQLGVPYKYATAKPGVSFDCSGLTLYAWQKAGVSLPHQSRSQYARTAHIPLDQAQPGDLIFYYTPISHVGIYIGGGRMVYAAEPGTNVVIVTVRWNKVVGVGRPG